MTLEAWALFCLTELLLCLKPGPACLVVVSLAVRRGRPAALAASGGVIGANATYFALSASGLAALIVSSSALFTAVRWAGAAYLIWLGARTLWRSFASRDEQPARLASISAQRSFWQGFVVQGANPGLLIYFTAILPQFVDAGAPLAPQVAILAFSSFAIELAVLWAYAALSAGAGRRAGSRFTIWSERAGGGLLIAAGAGLAALRRD